MRVPGYFVCTSLSVCVSLCVCMCGVYVILQGEDCGRINLTPMKFDRNKRLCNIEWTNN